ncbi:MAG TPA: thymidylate synthase, partial [Candidatus Paceibacterota bacterium]|nr:thymidylate synthase [Candidatus Paceibacterota bacterium]
MGHMEKAYLDLLKKVMDEGVDRDDRTGTGTRALFGQTMRFNMADGFPALTTKKLGWKAVKSELLWFLEGTGD